MIIKQMKTGQEAREALMEGITTLAGAVKSTLGPRGRTVLIESEAHTGGITVTKDGVTVARSINLLDPYQNLAIRSIRDAASNTATQAGDGTTSSIVLVEALLQAYNEHVTLENNVVEVTKNINNLVEGIIDNLDEKSLKVTGDVLMDVATVSANNDDVLGKLISDAYNKVGDSGVVTVEESKTSETYSEVTKGIRFKRGLMSPFHVTDRRRDKGELKDPLILVTDLTIKSMADILHILEYVIKVAKRPLFIIGDLDMDAQATLNKNIYEGKLKAAFVPIPDFGYRAAEMLEDLAVSVGATLVTEKMGNDWGLFDPATGLGTASSVTIGRDSTTIIHESEDLNEIVSERVALIREQLEDEKREDFIAAARARISMLEGNAAVIYVGGDSDIEKKEKKDRVDDSVLATRAAIEEGILPGGGVALLNESNIAMESEDINVVAAAFILGSALQVPFKQILTNAGKNPEDFIGDDRIGGENGYNSKTEQYGNMYDMGIIDPAKVTKNALKNAVSVATTIMMTDTVITNVRDMGQQ